MEKLNLFMEEQKKMKKGCKPRGEDDMSEDSVDSPLSSAAASEEEIEEIIPRAAPLDQDDPKRRGVDGMAEEIEGGGEEDPQEDVVVEEDKEPRDVKRVKRERLARLEREKLKKALQQQARENAGLKQALKEALAKEKLERPIEELVEENRAKQEEERQARNRADYARICAEAEEKNKQKRHEFMQRKLKKRCGALAVGKGRIARLHLARNRQKSQESRRLAFWGWFFGMFWAMAQGVGSGICHLFARKSRDVCEISGQLDLSGGELGEEDPFSVENFRNEENFGDFTLENQVLSEHAQNPEKSTQDGQDLKDSQVLVQDSAEIGAVGGITAQGNPLENGDLCVNQVSDAIGGSPMGERSGVAGAMHGMPSAFASAVAPRGDVVPEHQAVNSSFDLLANRNTDRRVEARKGLSGRCAEAPGGGLFQSGWQAEALAMGSFSSFGQHANSSAVGPGNLPKVSGWRAEAQEMGLPPGWNAEAPGVGSVLGFHTCLNTPSLSHGLENGHAKGWGPVEEPILSQDQGERGNVSLGPLGEVEGGNAQE